MGLRIKELERIYGIVHGNNQYGDEIISCPKTQTELADDMGIDVRTLQNYKKLTEMIPELEELVDTEQINMCRNRIIRLLNQHGKVEELTNNFTAPKTQTQSRRNYFVLH